MATKYIESRIAELETALKEPEDLSGNYRTIGLIRRALEDIRQYIRKNPFIDLAEEIHYFKILAPPLYGQLIYFVTVTETSMDARHSNRERTEALLRLELAKTEQFFAKHGEFCQYYQLNRSHMDDRIFIRDARENGRMDHIEVIMADDFCIGCYLAALLWANERLSGYFTEQLRILNDPDLPKNDTEDMPDLEWTDSTTDLVELVYALFLKGSFNHGKAKLKEIARWMAHYMKKDIANVYSSITNISQRKKVTLKFLDDLRDRTSRKLDDKL